jgi:hypothetical protein
MAKKMITGKYIYRCGMPGCRRAVGTNVAPSEYPVCNGTNKSHLRSMDFIESESKAIPDHVEEGHKQRKKEGRWL